MFILYRLFYLCLITICLCTDTVPPHHYSSLHNNTYHHHRHHHQHNNHHSKHHKYNQTVFHHRSLNKNDNYFTDEKEFKFNEKQKKRNIDDEDNHLLVNTQSGYVRGRSYFLDYHLKELKPYEKRSKRKYRVNAWLGIPFAEKPIGNLRFKRPLPVKSWPGILNATKMPNTCYQLPDTVFEAHDGIEMWNPNTKVDEDCLYLNIWTPHPKPRNAAIFVWIYGGGFCSGTSTLKIYDPKTIVAETHVIFISMQYRVSMFGFLYLDDEKAPGNMGLIDQYLALKWIHNNAQYFGGDVSRITLVGESAGAVSVSFHLLSPLTKNLYRNAIMESGTALADWATLSSKEAIRRSTDILAALGCVGTVDEIIECALKIDPKVAIETSDEQFYSKATQGIAQYTFVPVK
jgi:acetylcholinesterase